MNAPYVIALCGLASSAAAQTALPAPPSIELRATREQPIAIGPEQNFTGKVRVSTPFAAQPPGRAGGATVQFDAGAHTAWHTHPLGQTLVITDGVGLVQQQGQTAQTMRVGDVVTIPAHVLHWHGAAPSQSMTHVAIAEKEQGISVNWQRKLTAQEYRTAADAAGEASTPLLQPARRFAHSEVLSAKQRSITLIAATAAMSDMDRLRTALQNGLDADLSINEAKEVLVQLYAYAGFPKSLNALEVLRQVAQDRQQRGAQDREGTEPSATIPSGAALTAVGMANQTFISGGPVQGPVFAFAPIINQYLQTHLFGAIFERDTLDWQSRELATVGALSAIPGVEVQLRSHMRASLRVGLSPAQLHQLADALRDAIGPDAAARAHQALQQALPAPKG